jgi:hypothetical protein
MLQEGAVAGGEREHGPGAERRELGTNRRDDALQSELDASQGDLQWLGIDRLEHAGLELLVHTGTSDTQHAHRLSDGNHLDDRISMERIAAVGLANARRGRTSIADESQANLRLIFETRQRAQIHRWGVQTSCRMLDT